MPKLPLNPTAVLGVVKELRVTDADLRPLLVGGAPERAKEIHDALGKGAEPGAIRILAAPTAYDFEGANVLVYAVDGAVPGEEDEKAFQLASRKGVEIVCVVFGASAEDPPTIPYVLDSDVIPVPPGAPLPLESIAERAADRAGDSSHHLAARVPALREAVVQEIIKRFALQNGVLGVAIFIPGADFPVLTLNQIRMVLRIASAHGERLDRERAFEVLVRDRRRPRLPHRCPPARRPRSRPRLGGQGRRGLRRHPGAGGSRRRLLRGGRHENDRAVRPVLVLAFSRMEREERQEALLIEEADAWFEYLEATQAELETGRYDEVEPWAWARLNQRLRAVERKRTGLRPAAA